MLPRKWNADNGDEQNAGKNKMDKSGVQTTTNQPDNIAKNRQATHSARGRHNLFAKWP